MKRQRVEEIVGVLEFEGRSKEDPEFVSWLEDHKASNGGKLRVSQGGKGVRVAFSKAADMERWKRRVRR